MGERNPTRRQYLLAAGASGVAMLSGCSSGGDDGSGDGNGSGQDENGDSGGDGGTNGENGDGSGQGQNGDGTDDGDSGGGSSSGFTPWISQYGGPQKTRATPDPTPADLESKTSYDGRVGNTVAVTDAGVFTLGSVSIVSRVDPSTGETEFSRSPPVGEALFVQNGIVVCGERRGGGRLAGLDAETGERAWLVEPGGTIVPFPAGDGIGYAGSHIGVLDPASGDTRWDRDRSLLSSDQRQGTPNYSFRLVAAHPESDTAFAYTGSGESEGIGAYDLTNGERRWKNDGSAYANSRPIPVAVRDDTVYVSRTSSSTGQLLALDRTTGDERWTVDRSLTGSHAAFAVDGDGIYIANGSSINDNASVFALDPADGSEQWSTPVSSNTAELIAAGDALVRIGNRVELLSKTDGELQRSASIDQVADFDGSVVADGRLYLPAGRLVVYGTR